MVNDGVPYVDRDLGDFIPVVAERCLRRSDKAALLRLAGFDVWVPLSCLGNVDLVERPLVLSLPRWVLEQIHLLLPRRRWHDLHVPAHPGDWKTLADDVEELVAHVHYLYRAFISLNQLAERLATENVRLRKESGHDA